MGRRSRQDERTGGPVLRSPGRAEAAHPVLALQRQVGNRATVQLIRGAGSAIPVQREGVGARLQAIEAELQSDTKAAVRRFSPNSKKKSATTWIQILEKVKPREATWRQIRNHVMLGEATSPPKGLHSTADSTKAHAEGVGEKSPKGVGRRGTYKQWIKKKTDKTNENVKISTFFPETWTEQRIQAAFLLATAGEDHRVAGFRIETESDATAFPDVDHPNPEKPPK